MAMRLLPAFGFCLQPGIQSESDWSATDDVTSHDQQQQQSAVTNDSDDDTVGAPPGYVDYTDVKKRFYVFWPHRRQSQPCSAKTRPCILLQM